MPGNHSLPTPLQILIVTQYFWPENFGINDLALGLKNRGHDVTVLTGIPNYPSGNIFPGYGYFRKRQEDFNGIPVMRIPLIPRGDGGKVRLVLNYFSFTLLASILAPFYCKEKYDIIFVYEPSPITIGVPAIVLKKITSAPIIFWIQDLWPESLSATGSVKSKSILNLVERLVRWIYRRCDLILTQSRTFIPSILKLGVETARTHYFPNSAEDLYRPMDPQTCIAESRKMPDGFRVTFAGNIGAAQGFDTILEAAARLREYPDIQWIIIGDGRRLPWVKAEVEKRGLNGRVHFLGRHPAEAMPRFFALSDVLLVSLKRDPIFTLTIPSKVQSYLACARPVIAALDGEGARIIDEAGAGLTCPAESPEDLAKAVIKLYEMPVAKREKIGEKGRCYFENNFEREMLLDRLEKWMIDPNKNRLNRDKNNKRGIA